MMKSNNSFEIQSQIWQTVLLNQENVKNLKTWEKEMKEKETEFQKNQPPENQVCQINLGEANLRYLFYYHRNHQFDRTLKSFNNLQKNLFRSLSMARMTTKNLKNKTRKKREDKTR